MKGVWMVEHNLTGTGAPNQSEAGLKRMETDE